MSRKMYVPNEILLSFKDVFPEVPVSEVEWSWEVPGKIYQAEFVLDGVEHEAEFFLTGEHLLTEREMDLEDLPEAVVESLKAIYPSANIEDAEEVELNNGLIMYELSVANGTEEMEMLFREDGKYIAKGEDL